MTNTWKFLAAMGFFTAAFTIWIVVSTQIWWTLGFLIPTILIWLLAAFLASEIDKARSKKNVY